MALITRVSRLFTADVHAVLDRIEEPEVVLKQAIREMAEEVAQGEQHLSWLAAEQQQIEQGLNGADDAIAAFDSELDLCFEAGEEDLARSLVRRKLVAEQQHKHASQQLDAVQHDHKLLAATLAEQSEQLAEMQQKADLLVDAPAVGPSATFDPSISQDAIDVAFLKEKHLRGKGGQS